MQSHTLRFWLVTLAALVTMAVTASLGLWQLGRADQKIALQTRMDERAQLPAWRETDLLRASDPSEAVYRPVRLRGTWEPQASVFLDNRQMKGRPGFFMVTPLRLQGSDQAVLVQRGWVARDFNDRRRLPTIDTPPGPVEIAGRLAPPPGQLLQLGGAGEGLIRQNIELSSFAQETGLTLLNVSVLQTSGGQDGLQREWPTVTLGVDKHHGYAFQWFGLCTLAGILYVWFQFIAPRRKRSLHAPDV